MTTKKRTSSKKAPTKAAKKKVTTTAKKTAAKKVAKKATKKTAAKKTAKKSTTKGPGKKLIVAKGADCFWVNKGPILKDLRELEAALNTMSEAMFKHHVGKGKNDFADWVEYTLKDTAAATDIRKARKPKTARTVIVRHLKHYQLPK